MKIKKTSTLHATIAIVSGSRSATQMGSHTYLGSTGLVKTRSFSASRILSMNRNELVAKLVELRKEKEALNIERENLKLDRESAKLHIFALVKKENNQPISIKEQNAMNETKENFPAFFDNDSAFSNVDLNPSPYYKERTQVAQLLDYLVQERDSNTSSHTRVKSEWNEINAILTDNLTKGGSSALNSVSQSASIESKGESSALNSVSQSSNTESKGESSALSSISQSPCPKSNTESIGEASQSTLETSKKEGKKKETPSDYIDSLPVDYSPIDDAME